MTRRLFIQACNCIFVLIIISAAVPFLENPKILIGRFREAQDLSSAIPDGTEIRLLILILTPSKSKLTKTSLEISRSISTFFASSDFVEKIEKIQSADDFFAIVNERKAQLTKTAEDNLSLEIQELPGKIFHHKMQDLDVYEKTFSSPKKRKCHIMPHNLFENN